MEPIIAKLDQTSKNKPCAVCRQFLYLPQRVLYHKKRVNPKSGSINWHCSKAPDCSASITTSGNEVIKINGSKIETYINMLGTGNMCPIIASHGGHELTMCTEKQLAKKLTKELLEEVKDGI